MKTPRILVRSSLAVLLAAPFGCSESTDPAVQPPAGQMSELKVGQRPESVARGFGGRLYVSVQNAVRQGDDGEVKVVDGTKVSTFVGGMKEPKGIAFVDNYLIVTDVTQVWKVDSAGVKSVLAEGGRLPRPGRLPQRRRPRAGQSGRLRDGDGPGRQGLQSHDQLAVAHHQHGGHRRSCRRRASTASPCPPAR